MDSKEAPAPRPSFRGGMRAHVLARVQRLIHERLAEPLRVEDLAREACMSPFHFSRMFKQATGMTPHAYLVARRLARAEELLVESALPLADIARQSGFSTQAHLCNVFRKHTRLTPAAYRRQKQQAQRLSQFVAARLKPLEEQTS